MKTIKFKFLNLDLSTSFNSINSSLESTKKKKNALQAEGILASLRSDTFLKVKLSFSKSEDNLLKKKFFFYKYDIFFQPIPNMPNIIVNKSNNKNIAYLFYKNKKIKCFVGKNGIGIKQKEGDYVTPKGVFKVLKIFTDQINSKV